MHNGLEKDMREIKEEKDERGQGGPQQSKKRNKWIILAVIAVVAIVVGCAFAFSNFWQKEEPVAARPMATAEQAETPEPQPEKKAVLSTFKQISDREVIDFEGLAETNEDFVAWLSVPGTAVDYPVVYKADDNFYYLDIDFEGNESKHGSVYIDMANGTNFMDPVTVAYGHNMKDKTMFASLHDFEDETFFEEHDEIRVYMPDGMMVYKIFAAYETNDDSILYEKDYSDQEVFEKYVGEITANKDISANIRDMQIGQGDKILTLSTCVQGEDEKRYVVQGVLQKGQVEQTIPQG